MENINVISSENTNKINKYLLIILLVVGIVTTAILSFYLYKKSASNNDKNLTSDIQSNDKLFVYSESVPEGIVGALYGTAVFAAIYNQNVEIEGRLGSVLPQGLELTGCRTEFNSLILDSPTPTNSLVLCSIQGTPEESGNFTVRVYFSIPGNSEEIYKDLPLVISQ